MKIKFKFLFLSFLFILCFNSCNELDKNEPVDLTRVTITKNSELFGLLTSYLNRNDDPMEDKVCIDFIYPFKLFIYDSNLIPQGEVILFSDVQFSTFLSQLPINQSISLSYPIETTFPDGSTFSVTNDQELKVALDSCSREDIISYCNGMFGNQNECVWTLPYTTGYNNDFSGGFFSADFTGTITLHHLNNTYSGTWVFLYLNNQLYLNINLSGSSPTSQGWNYNFKVIQYNGTNLTIQTPDFTRLLKIHCSTEIEYGIGQVGPSGGIIAYDKGIFENGWRYIEVAQEDLNSEEWGCINREILDSRNDNLGSGYQNSVAITNTHLTMNNYMTNPSICSNQNNGTLSSHSALNYIFNQNIEWFIPSKNDLEKIYQNLHLLGLGNFENGLYWSSTEANLESAKCINFATGEVLNLPKNSVNIKTRAIRYF